MLVVLMSTPGPAICADRLPIVVDADPVVSATLIAAELSVRMPERVVSPGSGARPARSAYAVVVRAPGGAHLTLEVRTPGGQTFARHTVDLMPEPQTAREVAVLAEGAIRLHQKQLDELLARLASDVPRVSVSAAAGGRLFIEGPRLGPAFDLELRVRVWRRLLAGLTVHGGLPHGGEAQGVDYSVTLLSLRVALAYALPFGACGACAGPGLEVQLVHGRFELPSDEERSTNDVYGAPFARLDLEWPRERRLRLVVSALALYALGHPEYRFQDAPVTRLGAFAVELALGGRWAF
jgi:hypothetical protein